MGATRTKFAGAADRLARWCWNGDDLVPNGVFDIREQQMKDSPYDDENPMFEVGWRFDVTATPDEGHELRVEYWAKPAVPLRWLAIDYANIPAVAAVVSDGGEL